jgi:hypothetical protein
MYENIQLNIYSFIGLVTTFLFIHRLSYKYHVNIIKREIHPIQKKYGSFYTVK